MAYPDTDLVSDYLEELGLTATAGRLTSSLNSAIQQWEQGTGFIPFLAGASNTERTYTLTRAWMEQAARSRLFDLRAGLVPGQTITIVLDGTTLTEGEDWWPMPAVARDTDEPYTMIRFSFATISDYNGLSITGRWGYCLSASIPADVTDAIAQKAASIAGLSVLAAGSASAPSGALVRAKEDGVEKQWAQDKDPLTKKSVLESWAQGFADTVESYRLGSVV